jgi:hypothetical protein
MNKRKMNISIRNYTYCVVVVIALLCGLIYLLSSCVKEEGNNRRDGEKMELAFTVHIGSYGNDVVVETRSAKKTELVSNVFRVATDVFMYATLEEEHPVTTRATYNLNNGARVRIMAFSGGPAYTTEAGQADYTVTATGLTPVTSDLSVATGNTYKFVAFSFNDNLNLPVHVSNTGIDFDATAHTVSDLLLGITDEIPIPVPTTTVQPVELTLEHTFSRVKVEASTLDIVDPIVNINKMGGVSVSPSYSLLRLNTATRQLSPTNPGNPENTFTKLTQWRQINPTGGWLAPDALNFREVESDYAMIYTHAANVISLFIDTLIVDNTNLGHYEFRLSNINVQQLPMVAGHSYKLKLNFQRQIWAGSNIFWDGTKLTFLPETTPPSQQGYQGVYFMWGSLVGISPIGTFNDATTTLYMPIPGTGGVDSWRMVTATNQTSNGWGGLTMADIPHVQTGTLYSPNYLDDHTARNYLYSEVHDDFNGNATFIGDICHFLSQRGYAPSGNWRMPNAREFGREMTEYTTSEFRDFPVSGSFTPIEDGKYDLNNQSLSPLQRSFIMKNASNTIFPDGLSRDYPGGNINILTRYLTGSPTSMNPVSAPNTLDACYNMNVTGNVIVSFTGNPAPLGTQGLVRCLKLDGGGKITWIIPTVDVEDWDIVGTPFGQGDTNGQGNVQY